MSNCLNNHESNIINCFRKTSTVIKRDIFDDWIHYFNQNFGLNQKLHETLKINRNEKVEKNEEKQVIFALTLYRQNVFENNIVGSLV
jgi:hypothetical protein